MKTIIWKELRENLKWSALGLLCLTSHNFAIPELRSGASVGGSD